jgi:hypothetical protein
MKNLYKIEDELYIISSSEKIKENTQSFKEGLNGDWFYNTIYNFITRTGDITPYDFKIILTTNKLLIKDGVQEISEDFLQWFVQNSDCESVEVERELIENPPKSCGYYYHYKIMIPQKEPKQNLEKDNMGNKELKEETKNKFTEKEVESICIEMVNWAIDNIGNPNAKSGEKFKQVIKQFKKK